MRKLHYFDACKQQAKVARYDGTMILSEFEATPMHERCEKCELSKLTALHRRTKAKKQAAAA